jgi:hypothetical protein
VRKNNLRYRQECKEAIDLFRQNGCIVCEEKESCCLAAHHIDPTKKDFEIADYPRLGFKKREF